MSLVASVSLPDPTPDRSDSPGLNFSRPSFSSVFCFIHTSSFSFFRRFFPYQRSRLSLVATASFSPYLTPHRKARILFACTFLVRLCFIQSSSFSFFRRFFPYQRSRLRLVASASLPDPTSDSADYLAVHFSRPSFSSVSSVPLNCRLLQFTVVKCDRTVRSVWDQVASTACLHWTLFLFGFYSLIRIRRMGERGGKA